MKYRTIVADPPWPYGWKPYGFVGKKRRIDRDLNRQNFQMYRQMSIDEIAALSVSDIANKDAHLYLWTTNRFLRDSYEVVDAWEFAVSKILVWCKPPHPRPLGGAFGSATEFVLFCRRGKLATQSRVPRDWFEWPRAHGWHSVNGRHSGKPDAFLDLVEQVSPGPYLEMFARRARFGWDYWGDESLQTVEHLAI